MSQMPSGMPMIVIRATQAIPTTMPEAHHPMNSHQTNRTSRFGPRWYPVTFVIVGQDSARSRHEVEAAAVGMTTADPTRPVDPPETTRPAATGEWRSPPPSGGQRDVSTEVPVMTNAATVIANKPAWVDLGTHDAEGAREFYSKLFGWHIQVSPDPQYGGYGRALSTERTPRASAPRCRPSRTIWALYIGTDDVDALPTRSTQPAAQCYGAVRCRRPGPDGRVRRPWRRGDLGVAADLDGRLPDTGPAAYDWGELNARKVDESCPSITTSSAGRSIDRRPEMPYTEFQVDGESIAGRPR